MKTPNFRYDCALLIDDDATDLFISTKVLEISKFARKIVVKKNSLDALAYLREESSIPENIPDFVFLDYFMPMTTGKEFLDHFSNLPKHVKDKSKVIMLSVLDEELNPGAYNRKMVYETILKPLTEDKLENI
jgi:CheY-like chemotaxis protein